MRHVYIWFTDTYVFYIYIYWYMYTHIYIYNHTHIFIFTHLEPLFDLYFCFGQPLKAFFCKQNKGHFIWVLGTGNPRESLKLHELGRLKVSCWFHGARNTLQRTKWRTWWRNISLLFVLDEDSLDIFQETSWLGKHHYPYHPCMVYLPTFTIINQM